MAFIQTASLALTVSVSMATPLPESSLFESGSEFNLENKKHASVRLGAGDRGKRACEGICVVQVDAIVNLYQKYFVEFGMLCTLYVQSK